MLNKQLFRQDLNKQQIAYFFAIGFSIVFVGLSLYIFFRDFSYSMYDDAFIYLTYARNIADGCGVRFHCDAAPVEGFTSPLYLAMLAAAKLVTSKMVTVTQIYGSFFVGLTILAAALPALHEKAKNSSAVISALCLAAVAIILSADQFFLLNMVIGLETPLAMFAVTLIFIASLKPHSKWLTAMLIIGVLSRPECAVFIPAALIFFPEMRKFKRWVWIAASLVAMTLVRLYLFHDVLPNTFWAKAGGTWYHFTFGAEYALRTFKDFPMIAAAPLVLLVPKLRRQAGFFLAGCAVWYLSFLRSGGDFFMYSRLAAPMVPVLTLFGVLGLVAVMRSLVPKLTLFGVRVTVAMRLLPKGIRTPRSAPVRSRISLLRMLRVSRSVYVAAAIALLLVAGDFSRMVFFRTLKPQHGFRNVLNSYVIAQHVKKNYPNATVATVAIGAVSYYSGNHVIDMVGLTEKQVARSGNTIPDSYRARYAEHRFESRLWIGHERHNTKWVLSQKPDVIIISVARRSPYTSPHAYNSRHFAEEEILRQIRKSGYADYAPLNPEIAPGIYWLMMGRRNQRVAVQH